MVPTGEDDPEHQLAESADAQKENVEPSEDTLPSRRQPLASSDRTRQPRHSSTSKASKTRRGKQSTDSSSNSRTSHRDSAAASETTTGIRARVSAAQDSAASATAASDAVTHRNAAQDSAAQSSMPLQASDSSSNILTPVKAQQPKAAADLDKLMGSRRKPVPPHRAVETQRDAADSPVAALRSQLRQVKLESSPARGMQGFSDGGSGSQQPNEATSARQAVALRRVKQEPGTEGAEAADAQMNDGTGKQKKVSALKGFWETQTSR